MQRAVVVIEGCLVAQARRGAADREGAVDFVGREGVDEGAEGLERVEGAVVLERVEGAEGLEGVEGVEGAVVLEQIEGAEGLEGVEGAAGLEGAEGGGKLEGVEGAERIEKVVDLQQAEGLEEVKSFEVAERLEGPVGVFVAAPAAAVARVKSKPPNSPQGSRPGDTKWPPRTKEAILRAKR